MRILFTKRGCPFCNNAVKIVNKLNLKLPIEKRIRIIDCSSWEEFGLRDVLLMNIFEKMNVFDGYPMLYIDGILIESAPTQRQMKLLLEQFLNNDFIL